MQEEISKLQDSEITAEILNTRKCESYKLMSPIAAIKNALN
jgi:hypothetical protein